MTTKEQLLKKISFKEKSENISIKLEPKLTLKAPSFYSPQPLNNGSNFQEKKNCKAERFNSFCSYKSGLEFDMLGHAIFPGQSRYIPFPFLNFPFGIPSKINSTMSNLSKENNNNNIKFEPNHFFLNCFLNEKEDILQGKKEEIKNNNKINKTDTNFNYLLNFFNGRNDLNQSNLTPEKNINLNLNMNMETPTNSNSTKRNNSGTKFFTNHNYGYKCSCSKTKCNRKYCECFNSGNYCIDCNCKNCNNKPPLNSYTNKHPTDDSSKNKKEKIICTCTKSGCNKNYCECFKNGQKCSILCRCISCENNDRIINKNKNMSNYECCPANSIYIIKNNIIIENIKNEEKIENKLDFYPSTMVKENFMAISKKRKREETKDNEESFEKKKKNQKYSDEINLNLFNDPLFDKNGKVILRHLNLIQI